MSDNRATKSFLNKMYPKIIKATVKGAIYFVLIYLVPRLLISQMSRLAPDLFAGYGQLLGLFAAVIIFFVVASELTSGTIFQHAFNVGRALVLIVFFVLALNGGIVSFNLNVESAPVNVWVDLRIYLVMLITIDLIGLARSILQAVNFLSERAEQQLPLPRPVE